MSQIESCPVQTVRPTQKESSGLLLIVRNNELCYLTFENIEKLIKLEVESEYSPSYPHFSKEQIEYLIKVNIGVDRKTINKYRECIRLFISTKYKIKEVPYNNWNLTGLYESLKQERDRAYQSSINRNQVRKLKDNSRQRCKTCRKYLKENGRCSKC